MAPISLQLAIDTKPSFGSCELFRICHRHFWPRLSDWEGQVRALPASEFLSDLIYYLPFPPLLTGRF